LLPTASAPCAWLTSNPSIRLAAPSSPNASASAAPASSRRSRCRAFFSASSTSVALAVEPALDVRVVGVVRAEDRVGELPLGVELRDEGRDDAPGALAGRRVERVAVAVDELAVLAVEARDGGRLARDVDAEDVDTPLAVGVGVTAVGGDGAAPLAVDRFDGLESVSEVRRPLEGLVGGGRLHLAAQRVGQYPRFALEEALDGLDVREVGLPVDVGLWDAGAATEADVVVQARPVAGGELVVGTAPQAVGLPGGLDDRLQAALVGEGAEDRRALLGVAGGLDAGELVVGQLDQRVGLVVFQADVVAGPVALDEVRLQQERLGLRVGDRDIDGVGLGDHPADALAAGVRVGADPVPDVDGLPDVEDPLAVEELVDAGLGRQVGCPLADGGGVHRRAIVGRRVSLCRPPGRRRSRARPVAPGPPRRAPLRGP